MSKWFNIESVNEEGVFAIRVVMFKYFFIDIIGFGSSINLVIGVWRFSTHCGFKFHNEKTKDEAQFVFNHSDGFYDA